MVRARIDRVRPQLTEPIERGLLFEHEAIEPVEARLIDRAQPRIAVLPLQPALARAPFDEAPRSLGGRSEASLDGACELLERLTIEDGRVERLVPLPEPPLDEEVEVLGVRVADHEHRLAIAVGELPAQEAEVPARAGALEAGVALAQAPDLVALLAADPVLFDRARRLCQKDTVTLLDFLAEMLVHLAGLHAPVQVAERLGDRSALRRGLRRALTPPSPPPSTLSVDADRDHARHACEHGDSNDRSVPHRRVPPTWPAGYLRGVWTANLPGRFKTRARIPRGRGRAWCRRPRPRA